MSLHPGHCAEPGFRPEQFQPRPVAGVSIDYKQDLTAKHSNVSLTYNTDDGAGNTAKFSETETGTINAARCQYELLPTGCLQPSPSSQAKRMLAMMEPQFACGSDNLESLDFSAGLSASDCLLCSGFADRLRGRSGLSQSCAGEV